MAKTKNEAREAAKKAIVKKRKDEANANVGKKVAKTAKPPKPTKKRRSDEPGGIKKPHRFHSGTRALMDIRKFQSRGKFAWITLIPKVIVYRLIKEELAQLGTTGVVGDFKLKRKAFADMHQAIEQEGLKQLQGANMVAIHAGRQGIEAADLQAANLIRENHTARPIALPGFAIKGKRVRKRARPAASRKDRVLANAAKVYQNGKALKQARKAPAQPQAKTDFGDDETTSGGASDDEEEEEEAAKQAESGDEATTDSQATAPTAS